jgi:uroporphyrin-III C-methyltransferase/precorrin-2 dehydrogenase/sirohydrochlorin ferrochelatase
MAGVPLEIVPGVSTAIAAPALAGIPVTHRGLASGFLVLSGHAPDVLEDALGAVRANGVSLVVLMGLGGRERLAARLLTYGWRSDTPSAMVCAAATPDAWTWTGPLARLATAAPPDGQPGVIVIGEVVAIRDALGLATASDTKDENEVTYGRGR